MKGILKALVFIVLVSSSFDIFFNLNLGGFNVRTCYLASFAFLGLYAMEFKDAGRFRFLGLGSFLIWFAFLIAFVGNTQFLNRNIGYLAWLAFNLFACYALYKYSQRSGPETLIRLYLLSFFVMACVGIAQFLLSTLGIHVLVTMWWRAGSIPRVNALSYEPSYYATYMLIGFVFLFFAQRKNILFFKPRFQLIILLSVALSILLSTSRMGILFMASILVYDFLSNLLLAAVRLRISRINFLVSLAFVAGLFGIIGKILLDDKARKMYLAGTGLESTASHSKDTRILQMSNVFYVFRESPVVGYSLGGIAPAIAAYYGNHTTDQKKAKEFEGLNIFLEVLAASGIFGFLFFASWLFQVFRGNVGMARILHKAGMDRESGILVCLRYALVAELLILVLSQNILRPYLWMLIGMMNALYFAYKDRLYSQKETTDAH